VERAPNGIAGLDLPSVGNYPTMKDRVYQALRERIVLGDLQPADRLIEADLAARFGISKTPVREALLTLEAEGFVTLRAHRGAEVSRLSVEEYRDLQYARDALEFGALPDIVASITDADLAEGREHLAEMVAAHEADDYRRYRRAQRRLHRVLLSAAGYPTLVTMAVELNDRLDRYGQLLLANNRERWAGDLEFNRLRLELIRQRDAEAAIKLVRERHASGIAALRGHLGPDKAESAGDTTDVVEQRKGASTRA
jgi:DNA-binding GntR family transcriptional regulator